MRQVEILGVHGDPQSGATIVLLGEPEDPTRVLPIFIGPAEAQSIALALAGVEPPRPGTHDLAVAIMEAAGVELVQVVVSELSGGTFFADVEIETAEGSKVLSARPSDSIALAVRTNAPVYVEGSVFDEAAVSVEHEADEPFDDAEIEEIVADFQEFLAGAEPSDFVLEPPGDEDGGTEEAELPEESGDESAGVDDSGNDSPGAAMAGDEGGGVEEAETPGDAGDDTAEDAPEVAESDDD